MGRVTELLETAPAEQSAFRSFTGALLRPEARDLLRRAPGNCLIDVRSRAERELSDVIPVRCKSNADPSRATCAIRVSWHNSTSHRPGIAPAVHLPQRPTFISRRCRCTAAGRRDVTTCWKASKAISTRPPATAMNSTAGNTVACPGHRVEQKTQHGRLAAKIRRP